MGGLFRSARCRPHRFRYFNPTNFQKTIDKRTECGYTVNIIFSLSKNNHENDTIEFDRRMRQTDGKAEDEKMNKSAEQARKHASIRKKNIKLIINLLRAKPDSTFGVGKTLNLSSGGAKKLVDDIASGGIIARVPEAAGRACQGRPPIGYGVNPRYCLIAVVNYAAERVSLYDFAGEEIDSFGFGTNNRVTDEDVYALTDRVEEMLDRHRDRGREHSRQNLVRSIPRLQRQYLRIL